jgi:hypothetical protein
VSILKRLMIAVAAMGAAGAIAGGSIPVQAATTSGVRYDNAGGVSVYGASGAWCSALLLSAAASTGSPAYVSAMVENTMPNTCMGWLEDSVNNGAWTDVSPQQTLPAAQGFNNFPWYKTANYYAGPGTRVRACVQPVQGTTGVCSSPVTLAASTAAAPNDATSVYYAHNGQAVSPATGTGNCSVYLSSNSMTKTAASEVNMTLNSIQTSCTGWLESSTNSGKTWEQATATYSAGVNEQWAFSSPAIADGTGELVRACAKGTGATVCTAAW